MFGQSLGQGLGVGQIDFVEGRPAIDGLAVSAVEIIDHHDAVPGLDQLFHGVRADIARPAGDHDVHEFSFVSVQCTISSGGGVPCQPLADTGTGPCLRPRRREADTRQLAEKWTSPCRAVNGLPKTGIARTSQYAILRRNPGISP